MARETIRHQQKNKESINEEPNCIIIQDSNTGLVTIVSAKAKRKYVRKNNNETSADGINKLTLCLNCIFY